jgi:hypothetical protein
MTWMSQITAVAICVGPALAFAQPAPLPAQRPPSAAQTPAQAWEAPPASPLVSESTADQLAVVQRPPVIATPEKPISLYDAIGVEPGRFGVAGAVGFPLMSVEAAYGLASRLTLIAGVNAFVYKGEFVQPGVAVKVNLYENPSSRTALALQIGAAYAFFGQLEVTEDRAARWMTGERDIAATAQLVASTTGIKKMPMFLAVGIEPNIDLTPLSPGPLSGAPPAYTVGANIPVHMGIEIPLTRYVNMLVSWGLDVHLRSQDSVAMPFALFGLELGTGASHPG